MPSEPKLLLVIEDDPDCRAVLALLLAELWPACALCFAACLTEAERVLDGCLPDLVLADLKLTDSLPETAINVLLDRLPPLLPLVVVSGYMTPLEGQEMLRLGADAFIVKGTSKGDIQQRLLHTWLRAVGRQARAQRHTWVAG